MTFLARNNSYRQVARGIHDLTQFMAFPLMMLALGSIFLGYFGRDLFVGWGTPVWNGSIFQLPQASSHQIEGEFLNLLAKLTPFFGSCFSVIAIFVLKTVGEGYLLKSSRHCEK